MRLLHINACIAAAARRGTITKFPFNAAEIIANRTLFQHAIDAIRAKAIKLQRNSDYILGLLMEKCLSYFGMSNRRKSYETILL